MIKRHRIQATAFPNPSGGFGASTLKISAGDLGSVTLNIPKGDDHKNLAKINKGESSEITVIAPCGFDANSGVVAKIGKVVIHGTVISGSLNL